MSDQNNLDALTVIIPAYNESEAIYSVVQELRAQVPNGHVLVVDDGSIDNTADIAESAGARVVRHQRNRGYGAALKKGIRAAQTPYVATYDADGQHRPKDLANMLANIGKRDVVIGARDKDSYQNLGRKPGKWFLGKIANSLVGQRIPDLNSGLRVMRRDVILQYLHLLPNGFSASTTLTVCMLQRGYDVEFVPIRTQKRVGKSTVRQFRDGLNTIFLIVRLVVLFNPMRFFLPPAVFLILAGLAYGIARAIISGMGVPTLAVLIVSVGFITGMFGLLADQISALRIEMFEKKD